MKRQKAQPPALPPDVRKVTLWAAEGDVLQAYAAWRSAQDRLRHLLMPDVTAALRAAEPAMQDAIAAVQRAHADARDKGIRP